MIFATNPRRLFVLAVCVWVFTAGLVNASQEPSQPVAASFTGLKVSFRLDTQTTRGMYMGERWVSPATYTGAQTGKVFTVEARAEATDGKGVPAGIGPAWTPSDPDMVEVTPARGSQVTITVRRAGESHLNITEQGVSKTLSIQAVYEAHRIQVRISQ